MCICMPSHTHFHVYDFILTHFHRLCILASYRQNQSDLPEVAAPIAQPISRFARLRTFVFV